MLVLNDICAGDCSVWSLNWRQTDRHKGSGDGCVSDTIGVCSNARYGISTGHRGAPRALTIGQHDREERASRTSVSRFRHRAPRHN